MSGLSISKNDTILFCYKFDPGIFSFQKQGLKLSHVIKGMTPCWSPEGDRIAFNLLRSLVVGDDLAQNLEFIDKNDGRDPSWSKDGLRIAYTYPPDPLKEPKIKVKDLISNDTEIISVGESPTWSYDSRSLAFWKNGIVVMDFLETKKPFTALTASR